MGQNDRAEPIFREVVAAAASIPPLQADPGADAPPDPQAKAEGAAAAHYVAGLGYAGLGDKEKARTEFGAVLAAVPDHLGAKIALARL